MVRVPTLGK
uniref:Uncharacterized protein n=1 Tax=Anguilla anguilla TaxID=7936 RepID=A0A0E9VWJ3_ANGAN